jgi:type II secretory pathway predicted ATPase ExeA
MMRAPWATHFGFTKLPFSKTVSAKDLLDRASHQEAIARIRFCIAEALLGVITGEVGVGKTVAVRAAISQLDQAAHHIVYLANPTVGTRGLYLTIVHALGARPRAQKAELIAQTQSLLATEEHERRRRVVLVIDEAHLLSPDQLEAIRLLNQRRHGLRYSMLGATGRPADPRAPAADGRLRCPGSADCDAIPDQPDGSR